MADIEESCITGITYDGMPCMFWKTVPNMTISTTKKMGAIEHRDICDMIPEGLRTEMWRLYFGEKLALRRCRDELSLPGS